MTAITSLVQLNAASTARLEFLGLSLTNLMVDHIVRLLQPAVDARLKTMAELQDHFGAFPD